MGTAHQLIDCGQRDAPVHHTHVLEEFQGMYYVDINSQIKIVYSSGLVEPSVNDLAQKLRWGNISAVGVRSD